MNSFQLNHHELIRGVNCTFRRYLYQQIDWNDRLIGIFGQRGIGKTTLLLQRIKSAFDNSNSALYLSLDHLWFQRNTLLDTVKEFCADGGTHLFLDNVHAYPEWMVEVGQLFDQNPSLHILFTASSFQSMELVKEEIKRGIKCYHMNTMSFREFLAYESILDVPPVSLDDLLANYAEFVKKINAQFNVVPAFRNYLEHGCYPFYWQDPETFFFRLADVVRETLDVDMPFLRTLYPAGVSKIKRLLMSIVGRVPTRMMPADMLKELDMHYKQAKEYISCLKDSEIIRYPNYTAKVMPVRQKTFIGNTNLLVALFGDKDNRRNMGETFFHDQISSVATLEVQENDDIIVNDKYTFMVGDPLRDYERIKYMENHFAAVYGLPKCSYNRIPIWAFGFCY
ncbi:AAA family ATPase [Parabacteroides bouchesdurhonensis]|uniref:AAA family ATPase n=1 Tax=Parabacteroides bouchesdurhonensis TaxID=1936995 RepID=UPI000E50C24A|nr:AAA family ATPase [Parabacteroides bouchesdurhonensis]RHJ93616.1 AAA family ATPase [Bacteroides sp. AM07-16]